MSIPSSSSFHYHQFKEMNHISEISNHITVPTLHLENPSRINKITSTLALSHTHTQSPDTVGQFVLVGCKLKTIL